MGSSAGGEQPKFKRKAGTPAWPATYGIAAAESELLESDGRVFLQSTRFDRTPVLGRRGFVSLAAVDRPWAHRLVVGTFGALIGNNDMHLGNAGLMGDLPLALAPIYDMLPMAFRPAASGEVVERASQYCAGRAGAVDARRIADRLSAFAPR
ncbi:hypothetical protein NB693_25720 [Pantoea ananatis]|uniref:hypothetical protein n=1 Tax=Pantoea ananas TaxID=553 RepID=UPI00221F6350|nr:hypothetical protein [Pantoea ananatis]